MKTALGELIVAEVSAEKSWYKAGPSDILVVSEAEENRVVLLSLYSSVIGSLKSNAQVLLYVKPEDAATARKTKADMPAAKLQLQMPLQVD
jgi:hypothetical protein